MQIFQKTIDPLSAREGLMGIFGGSNLEVDHTVGVGDGFPADTTFAVGVLAGVGVFVVNTAAPAGWAGIRAIMTVRNIRRLPEMTKVSARL
jgi:hypothetical protein